jgi:hypothetical protein
VSRVGGQPTLAVVLAATVTACSHRESLAARAPVVTSGRVTVWIAHGSDEVPGMAVKSPGGFTAVYSTTR